MKWNRCNTFIERKQKMIEHKKKYSKNILPLIDVSLCILHMLMLLYVIWKLNEYYFVLYIHNIRWIISNSNCFQLNSHAKQAVNIRFFLSLSTKYKYHECDSSHLIHQKQKQSISQCIIRIFFQRICCLINRQSFCLRRLLAILFLYGYIRWIYKLQ